MRSCWCARRRIGAWRRGRRAPPARTRGCQTCARRPAAAALCTSAPPSARPACRMRMRMHLCTCLTHCQPPADMRVVEHCAVTTTPRASFTKRTHLASMTDARAGRRWCPHLIPRGGALLAPWAPRKLLHEPLPCTSRHELQGVRNSWLARWRSTSRMLSNISMPRPRFLPPGLVIHTRPAHAELFWHGKCLASGEGVRCPCACHLRSNSIACAQASQHFPRCRELMRAAPAATFCGAGTRALVPMTIIEPAPLACR